MIKAMFDSIDLNIVWFVLVGILFCGYVILDGFDFGSGVVSLFLKEDQEKRIVLNAIGPVWDGNEVWLITAGGALFAAFPPVYATVFSGFYLAFMLLLLVLITRAVSIEFRGKQTMMWWRKGWDITFSISSILAAVLLGVALGNMMRGIELDHQGNYIGSFLELLNPYALLLGVLSLSMMAMHGGFYLLLKTEGFLQEKIRRITRASIIVFEVLLLLHIAVTIVSVPHALDNLNKLPWLYIVPTAGVICFAGMILFYQTKKYGFAFICSSVLIACLIGMFGIATYPYMVISNPNAEHSIDIYQGGATHYSLSIMTVIAMIGVPLVLTYTIVVYRVFRGKVKIDDSTSY